LATLTLESLINKPTETKGSGETLSSKQTTHERINGGNRTSDGHPSIHKHQSCSALPRLGVLVVLLPPRSLKKPFPKDERPFRVPKLWSAAWAGRVAEDPAGGFSPSVPVSSLALFWETPESTCKGLTYVQRYTVYY